MIIGIVQSSLEALISIAVIGPDRQHHVIEAVIDTGYNGFLTLPYEIIALLELPWTDLHRVTLADGSSQICDVYEGGVVWDNQTNLIEIEAAETQPLIGMELLEGYDLHIEVVEGGAVSIDRLHPWNNPL